MQLTGLRRATRLHPGTTGFAVFGLFVLIYAGPLLVLGPVDLTMGTGSLDFATMVRGIPWQITLTALLLAIIALIKWWDMTQLLRPIGGPVRNALAATVVFPLTGILLATVLLFDTQDDYNPLLILALVLCLNLFVALSEEALFRGILFGGLRQKTRLSAAILISSLAFGALHVVNAGIGQSAAETAFQVVNATALGILFCALVLQGASLWPAIVLHMIWNSYAMLGLAATEFAGDVPPPVVDQAPLTAVSFALPATILFIAGLVLYQYRSRTGHQLRHIVPVTPAQP